MALFCINPPEFCPNDRVVSLACHHPEIEPGTHETIVAPHIGSLYAVQLPDGELHTWFARFELEPVDARQRDCDFICPGSLARVVSTEGHPHHIECGMVVKIVKAIEKIVYYDVIVDCHGYHRWMAESEIASLCIAHR